MASVGGFGPTLTPAMSVASPRRASGATTRSAPLAWSTSIGPASVVEVPQASAGAYGGATAVCDRR